MGGNDLTERRLMEDSWLSELRSVMGEEVPVYLCCRPSSLGEVASRQVRERGVDTYMADIVRDDKGNISKVSYDRIYCRGM